MISYYGTVKLAYSGYLGFTCSQHLQQQIAGSLKIGRFVEDAGWP